MEEKNISSTQTQVKSETPPTLPTPPAPSEHRWIFRIISLIWALVIPPSLILLPISFFLFDAPGSENMILVKIMFFSIWLNPVLLLIACIGGFILSFRKNLDQNIRTAKIFAILPLMNIPLVIAVLIMIFYSGFILIINQFYK